MTPNQLVSPHTPELVKRVCADDAHYTSAWLWRIEHHGVVKGGYTAGQFLYAVGSKDQAPNDFWAKNQFEAINGWKKSLRECRVTK